MMWRRKPNRYPRITFTNSDHELIAIVFLHAINTIFINDAGTMTIATDKETFTVARVDMDDVLRAIDNARGAT